MTGDLMVGKGQVLTWSNGQWGVSSDPRGEVGDLGYEEELEKVRFFKKIEVGIQESCSYTIFRREQEGRPREFIVDFELGSEFTMIYVCGDHNLIDLLAKISPIITASIVGDDAILGLVQKHLPR